MQVDKEKIEQIALRSDFFQDILDKVPSRIVTWGNTGMLIILVGLCLAFRLIKYPDEIVAEALITNEIPPIDVYGKTNGRLILVLKHDKERVKQGDWVGIINNSANYDDVLKLKRLINAIDSAGIWGSIHKLTNDDLSNLGEIQNSYSQFNRSADEINLYIKTKSKEELLSLNRGRGKDIENKKQTIINQLNIAKKQLEISQTDFDRTSKLYQNHIITKPELETKESSLLNSKNAFERLSNELISMKIEKNLLIKESTTIGVEKNDTYLKLRNDVLQSYNALKFEISEWEHKYVIISPISGELNFYETRNQDQYLTIDKKFFTVAPSEHKSYYAIVKIPVSNSGKVHHGQKCIIKLHNYSYIEFGMIKGFVESISTNPKDGFYSVKVLLRDQLLTSQKKNLKVDGDLVGSAEIIIEDLSLFDRLFYSLISKNY